MPVIDIVLDLPDRRPRILLDLDDRHSNERTITGWIQGGRFYKPDPSHIPRRAPRPTFSKNQR